MVRTPDGEMVEQGEITFVKSLKLYLREIGEEGEKKTETEREKERERKKERERERDRER